MKIKLITIFICFIFLLTGISSALTIQNAINTSSHEIPLNGEIDGTIGSSNLWVGTVDVEGAYFKIEIDHHTNYRSYLIESILISPSGEEHGTYGIAEPYNVPDYYSGPIDPRYYYFETPEQGTWTLELTKPSNMNNVDFTITTSAVVYPERPGHKESIERNFYFPSLLLINYVDYAQPDGFVYEIDDVKDLDIRIGTTEVVQPLKGYGAITFAIPKGKAVLKENLIESKFSSVLFNPWTYDEITSLVDFLEFRSIVSGLFLNTFLGIFKTILEGFFDVIDYLNNDRSYDHGTGPQSSIWQDDENYDFFSFSYNTGDPDGGVATARQEFKFPFKLLDDTRVDILTHVTYTLTGVMGYTETVGYEKTVSFHKNTHYPPEIPTVNGPDEGIAGSPAGPFTACTTDPNENDGIYYGWDWDNDDEVDEWSEVYWDGDCDSRSHTWDSPGEYTFKVKARDGCHDYGEFSDPFTITITEEGPSLYSPTPEDGATNQETEIDFSWCLDYPYDLQGVKLYLFYAGTDKNNLNQQGLPSFDEDFYLKNFDYETKYYWQIRFLDVNPDDTSDIYDDFLGPVWEFTTKKEPLKVVIKGKSEAEPGDTITFTAEASGGKPDYSFAWDLDDDGHYDDDTGTTASKTFNSKGTYKVRVKVTDSNGDTDDTAKQNIVSKIRARFFDFGFMYLLQRLLELI
jgi:hypothetical protein